MGGTAARICNLHRGNAMRIIGLILAGALIAPLALARQTTSLGPAGALRTSKDPAETRRNEMVVAANALIFDAHDYQRALDEKLTPVIREYENMPRKGDPRLYSARSPKEALYYMLLAATAHDQSGVGRDAIDAGYAYGYAYYLSSYAQTELKHQIEAEALLRKAVELAPMNSLFIGELGYHIQMTGDNVGALEMFKRAEAATEYSPEETRIFDKTRALRGQGYALVELGKLDEAEAAYKAAIKLDPDDKKSKDELEYIRQQRAKH
ncbi:tetratricopeptide repeat protein [Solilutibacter silvestris]|uniref:tetratricopeptide repeat protein n=1 Tax=Solilutibacter silvestris TaxID=1645665 RepID=UPI003D357598